MKTEGKKFKLYIDGKEIAECDILDCNLNLLESAREMPELKTSRSWSAACSVDLDPDSVKDFCKSVMMKEIKELTDNYNRILKAKKR